MFDSWNGEGLGTRVSRTCGGGNKCAEHGAPVCTRSYVWGRQNTNYWYGSYGTAVWSLFWCQMAFRLLVVSPVTNPPHPRTLPYDLSWMISALFLEKEMFIHNRDRPPQQPWNHPQSIVVASSSSRSFNSLWGFTTTRRRGGGDRSWMSSNFAFKGFVNGVLPRNSDCASATSILFHLIHVFASSILISSARF